MTAPLIDASAVATRAADHLATPDQGRALAQNRWWPQSLAHGAVGVALLHIERARTGHGPWERAQTWLECAVSDGVDASPEAHLYYGAPALAFVLHQAATVHLGYERELEQLDAAVARIVAARLEQAHARMDTRGRLPVLAEFDAIRGLAGLSALLLTRDSYQDLLRRALVYLVRLTEPVTAPDGQQTPGWWASVDPAGKESPDLFPGGHANTGVAHGICGPLTVLASALRHGIEVDGHTRAISRILDWLDLWQRTDPDGVWWPYWITAAQHRGEEEPVGPQRPSWCYGAAGVAHAQLLAADALGDTNRSMNAQATLARTLTPQSAVGTTLDTSLCHGYSGLALLAHATGTARVPALLAPTAEGHDPDDAVRRLLTRNGIGLLEGAAGTATALHTLTTDPNPLGWASFLLIGYAKERVHA
ncbi:lanthionine synthetase C family protein [Nocardiopsis sp. CNT312]|uniref:lanthionine synthetase C family protein n=1 Tax=Nocardiopsis sp. CNT312 TaxID=1137268 RepID=UPI00048B78B3|nr:lanthionine synthetase C family protein [Nocardiopsis sp. CNT312]